MNMGDRAKYGWPAVALAVPALLLLAPAAPAMGQSEEAAGEDFTVDEELAERGEGLFESKQCFTCHTVGDGVVIGPDLDGLLQRRSLAWVRRMIARPEQMTAEDSIARALLTEFDEIQMPNPQVTEEEVEALIHYIASESSGGG